MKTTTNLVALSPAAQSNVDETGCDPMTDVAALRRGEHTRETLLAFCLDQANEDRVQGWREYVDAVCDAAAQTAIYARIGDENGYEVVRGARVECGDAESYDGVAILGWRGDYEDARAFAARHIAEGIDWAGRWDSPVPSREGCTEVLILSSLDVVEELVNRINASARGEGRA